MSTGEQVAERARWASSAAIAAFVLVAALSVKCSDPPLPAERNAAAADFSAARASETLARILADGRPHPTGSAENAAVRDRIVDEFERLGYRAEVQRRFVCSQLWSVCASIDNVIAHLPGSGKERGVLLAAHYDSVAAGPGAGDDGAGIAAILEVARALKAGPTLSRGVWFLAGDGEEAGLLDAEAFVKEPEFATIASVVNLEARGTRGPSQLFETQTGNAAIVALASAALPHPVGSSLAYEIYQHMPNNTDFTVFRRAGLAGVNFAFTGGPALYHTPRDNLDHLDPGSLQHHGENALAMVRTLANADADPVADHDRAFFDLFGNVLVSWPVSWNTALLALGVAGWFLLAVRAARRRQLRPWRLVVTCLLLPLLAAAAAMTAIGLQTVMDSTAPAAEPWTAQGGLLVFAFMALAVAVCALLAHPLRRWVGGPALALAALFVFMALASVTTALAPGTAFLALLPLLTGVVVGHAWPSRPVIWGGAAAIFTAAMWFPFAYQTYEALGFMGLPGVTLLMMVALLPLMPALAGIARSGLPVTGAALLSLAGLLAMSLLRPAFTDEVPRPLNLLYAGDGDGGRLFADGVPADELPPELMSAGQFETEPIESLPWSDRLRLAGRSGPALQQPGLNVLRDTPAAGGRRLQLMMQTRRGARVLYLVLPQSAKPRAVAVEGSPVAAPADSDSDWRTIEIIAPRVAGVRIDVELHTREPVTLYAVDYSDGLPAALDDVVRARDSAAVPIGSGDRTAVWNEVRLRGL